MSLPGLAPNSAYLQVDYICEAETAAQASARTQESTQVTSSSGQSTPPVDITSIAQYENDKLRSCADFGA